MTVKNKIHTANLNSYDRIYELVNWHINEIGMNIVPLVANEKRPLIPWSELKDKPLSAADITNILIENNSRSIGMLTGLASTRVVMDFDLYKEPEGWNMVKDMIDEKKHCIVRTARGGLHVHFRYTKPITTSVPTHGIEVKSDGALVVIPPTCTADGQYVYICDDQYILNPEPIPDELYDFLRNGVTGGSSKSVFIPGKGSFRVDENAMQMGSRDNMLYNVSRALLRGGMNKDEVRVYAHMLGQSCDPPMPPNEIETKVNSAMRGMPVSLESMEEQVRGWVETQFGLFDVSTMRGDLDISRNRWKELNSLMDRLVKENFIVRASQRSGLYRRRETDLEPIDVLNTNAKVFDIHLPLGLNDLVTIMPKNLIVFAGSQNAGKTAVLLNIMRDNMNKHRVRYLSSEMGANEFRARLNMFDLPIDQWRFEAYERTANFADVIDKDAVNIIDYLEIGDAFYQIGTEMAGIFDALDKGIAIIAIQKDPRSPLGRGGSFSMEKPRLYCTIDNEFPTVKMKIMKAKNWRRPEVDPNMLTRQFIIRGGCTLIPHGKWDIENVNPYN